MKYNINQGVNYTTWRAIPFCRPNELLIENWPVIRFDPLWKNTRVWQGFKTVCFKVILKELDFFWSTVHKICTYLFISILLPTSSYICYYVYYNFMLLNFFLKFISNAIKNTIMHCKSWFLWFLHFKNTLILYNSSVEIWGQMLPSVGTPFVFFLKIYLTVNVKK